MSKEEKKAIDKITRQIVIGKCSKNIGIPVYISDLEIVLNLIEKQQEQLQEKDKVINIMGEQLAGLTIFDNDIEIPLILGDKSEVIEYFTKKAREV